MRHGELDRSPRQTLYLSGTVPVPQHPPPDLYTPHRPQSTRPVPQSSGPVHWSTVRILLSTGGTPGPGVDLRRTAAGPSSPPREGRGTVRLSSRLGADRSSPLMTACRGPLDIPGECRLLSRTPSPTPESWRGRTPNPNPSTIPSPSPSPNPSPPLNGTETDDFRRDGPETRPGLRRQSVADTDSLPSLTYDEVYRTAY